MASERKFVTENIRRVLVKEHIRRQVERAGFGGMDIQRTPMGTRITIIAERPGMVIGRKGATIQQLTAQVEDDFDFDNPQIEVVESENPNLSPTIMAQKLAAALERGWHFRRAGHSTVRRIMENGARGCQVIIAGKLTGERHRTEKFKDGHIKFCGEPKNTFMRQGLAVAKRKPGITGIKVQIMLPDAVLPDEVKVFEHTKVERDAQAAAEAAATAAAAAALAGEAATERKDQVMVAPTRKSQGIARKAPAKRRQLLPGEEAALEARAAADSETAQKLSEETTTEAEGAAEQVHVEAAQSAARSAEVISKVRQTIAKETESISPAPAHVASARHTPAPTPESAPTTPATTPAGGSSLDDLIDDLMGDTPVEEKKPPKDQSP